MLWPILIAFFTFVQTTNATISGTVQDPSGARVPSAQIMLENVNTGVVLTNTANESGVYLFPSVPPGLYKLTAESPGFARYVVNELRVEAGARMNQNVLFALAAATQAVQVNAAESPLLSVSASVGATATTSTCPCP